MRTTLSLDDTLLQQASNLTSLQGSSLLNKALEVLVAHESAQRLAALGGSEPEAATTPRRRGTPSKQ